MSTTVDTSSLGARVRYARELVPASVEGGTLSTRELGALAGVSAGLVSAIELGERDNPTLETLLGLRVALGVELVWLCDGEGPLPTVESVCAAVARARVMASKMAARAS